MTISTREEEPKNIPCEIRDTDDGKYYVKYRCEQEGEVDIVVKYQDGKGRW